MQTIVPMLLFFYKARIIPTFSSAHTGSFRYSFRSIFIRGRMIHGLSSWTVTPNSFITLGCLKFFITITSFRKSCTITLSSSTSTRKNTHNVSCLCKNCVIWCQSTKVKYWKNLFTTQNKAMKTHLPPFSHGTPLLPVPYVSWETLQRCPDTFLKKAILISIAQHIQYYSVLFQSVTSPTSCN